MFETQKSGKETTLGEIELNIRTHASLKEGQDLVSGGVTVLCWHATIVENVLWKPDTNRGKTQNCVIRSSSVTMSQMCVLSDQCWVSLHMVTLHNVMLHSGEGDFRLVPVSTIEIPKRRFQAFFDISMSKKLIRNLHRPQNKTFLIRVSPDVSDKLWNKNTMGGWR